MSSEPLRRPRDTPFGARYVTAGATSPAGFSLSPPPLSLPWAKARHVQERQQSPRGEREGTARASPSSHRQPGARAPFEVTLGLLLRPPLLARPGARTLLHLREAAPTELPARLR